MSEDEKPVFKATNVFIQADAAAKKWTELGISEGVTFEPKIEADQPLADFVKKTITIGVEVPAQSEAFAAMDAMVRKAMGSYTAEQERFLRSVLLVGTAPGPHRHPGFRRLMERPVDHTRARKLYSARLRRDRRAKRQGRKPILHTVNVRSYFPRAEVRQGPGYDEMQIVASPIVPPGTAYVFDPQLMADAFQTMGPNIASMADRARDVTQSIRGMRPTGFWVDEITKINPEG